MDHIYNELPTCSVLSVDFNARFSECCNNDITNANDRALDTLTSSVRYKQFISKTTLTVKKSISCIDLIFCNNLNIYMVLTFQYLKNIIIISFLGKITFAFPFPRAMFVRFGIIEKQMLRVYKKLFRILIG